LFYKCCAIFYTLYIDTLILAHLQSNYFLHRKLAGKTLYITGASRGIGKAIALKAARDGANIVVAAKTAEPHPKLPGTIYSAAKESTILVFVLSFSCFLVSQCFSLLLAIDFRWILDCLFLRCPTN
jgi:hypothetical protein